MGNTRGVNEQFWWGGHYGRRAAYHIRYDITAEFPLVGPLPPAHWLAVWQPEALIGGGRRQAQSAPQVKGVGCLPAQLAFGRDFGHIESCPGRINMGKSEI